MYEIIVQELAELGGNKRYLNDRSRCRYCGTTKEDAFGNRNNAHAFPEALGNKALFALNECKACNTKFSLYEDALVKAVGPFLTLGGVKGKNGVRQTGRSSSNSKVRHSQNEAGRRLSITSSGYPNELFRVDPSTGVLNIRMPIVGDPFVPRYAYKALMKIAVSLLPTAELPKFRKAIDCLAAKDDIPENVSLQVGFSYAFVGNAPPALAGCLLRRSDDEAPIPYMIFILMAGSVCFQIWLPSDEADAHVPAVGRLGIEYTAQLPMPEGGYFPITFSDPHQFNWSSSKPILQPFEAFDLQFDPRTTNGNLTPVPRR